MGTTVLLVGLKAGVVDQAKRGVGMPDLEVLAATGVDEVRALFARTRIDHVIMGAGLELEDRVAVIREVFRASDSTTVHMKDRASGPGGFLPFIRAVLHGLHPEPASSIEHAT